MPDPIPTQKSPYPVDVVAGRKYLWCACGRSNRQPFCDGRHASTGKLPQLWTAPESGTVWFCGCKASATKPLCDGTHERLA
jgi:CDGSH iron-sulfur domain-containing protein 3